jgi:hypothetical protein
MKQKMGNNMFTKYGTLALLLSACVVVGFSSRTEAIDAKTVYDSCQSDNTEMLCVGFFVGVTDAHLTTMIMIRKAQELGKCKKWKTFSPKMLIASFEAEYRSSDAAFKPEDDPSFWLLNEVYEKGGCQKGIEI